MNVCIPSLRFFADNGDKCANVKLDELTSKLGLIVKFGPVYSPGSNSINDRNYAFTNIPMKKLIEEKMTPLSDTLVKAAT